MTIQHTALAASFLLALFPTSSFSAQGQSMERPGDGRLVCGIGKSFHGGRRAELMKRVGDEVMLFRGLPDARENVAFRQDKTFWYLTGIESPDAALILDGKTDRQILFLPEGTDRLHRRESWEGEIWDAGDDWVSDLTGFEEIRPDEELLEVLKELLDGREKVGVSLHPPIVMSGSYDTAGAHERHRADDPLDGRVSRTEALAAALTRELGVSTFDVAPTLVSMRSVKTSEEIAAMRRAARSGALAMSEAMRSTRPNIGEWEIDGLMSWMQIRHGAEGMAYGAIVAAGANACVLHYKTNDRRMQAGEVLLIDYGPEVDHYTTDITRSWPVSGEFTEYQAEIYSAVLDAQKAGIAAAKPGVTLAEVSAACSEVLKERGFGAFIKHGACHFIGMEVHDPGDYRAPVEVGAAFTIEPGAYDVEAGVGVRIEDVVVITEDGCEVLTGLVPKELDEVEDLVRAEGILDRIDGWSE